MIVNGNSLKDLRTSFKSLYEGAFSAAKPQWNRVAMQVPSTSSQNTYGWLGLSTRFREWVGDRVIQNLMAHDFVIKNKDFENTVGVRKTHIEDDNLGQYAPFLQMMGYDAAMHPDELVFPLLKNGWDTLCFDGQNFFDTDHPVLDENGVEQSVSNSGGGAGTPWFLLDVSKPIKPLIYQPRKPYEFVAKDAPTDDNAFHKNEFFYGVDGRGNSGYALWQMAYGSKQTLDSANYQAARAAMMAFKGDNGRPLNVMPNLLVVPPSLEGAAKEILEAERLANGATNTYRNTAELLVVPLLA